MKIVNEVIIACVLKVTIASLDNSAVEIPTESSGWDELSASLRNTPSFGALGFHAGAHLENVLLQMRMVGRQAGEAVSAGPF